MKKPWLAILLTIILTGAGHVYAGNRRVFGFSMMASEILLIAFIPGTFFDSLVDNLSTWQIIATAIGGVLGVFAFAFDAFQDVKDYNKRIITGG